MVTAKKVQFSEIESLHYYSSYGRGSWYTFGEYEFCRIVLLNKSEEIVITCLMVKNIRGKMEEILLLKADEHFSFLPLIHKH